MFFPVLKACGLEKLPLCVQERETFRKRLSIELDRSRLPTASELDSDGLGVAAHSHALDIEYALTSARAGVPRTAIATATVREDRVDLEYDIRTPLGCPAEYKRPEPQATVGA